MYIRRSDEDDDADEVLHFHTRGDPKQVLTILGAPFGREFFGWTVSRLDGLCGEADLLRREMTCDVDYCETSRGIVGRIVEEESPKKVSSEKWSTIVEAFAHFFNSHRLLRTGQVKDTETVSRTNGKFSPPSKMFWPIQWRNWLANNRHN